MFLVFSKILRDIGRFNIFMKKLIPIHSSKIWALFNIFERGFYSSNFRIFLEKKLQNLSSLLVSISSFWISYWIHFDFSHHDIGIVVVLTEWQLCEQEFIKQNSQWPNISFERISIGFECFWSHIVRGSNKSKCSIESFFFQKFGSS